MPIRISHVSRYRWEIACGSGIISNATTLDKTNMPGPLTLWQMMELLWRVKEMKITGTAGISYTVDELDPADEEIKPVNKSGSISFDMDMERRRSNENDFPEDDSDENEVYADNRTHTTSFENVVWRGKTATDSCGGHVNTNYGHGISRDDSGDYWLPRVSFTGSSHLTHFSLGAGKSEVIGSTGEGEDAVDITGSVAIYTGEGIPYGDEYKIATTELSLQGTPVNFPFFFRVSASSPAYDVIADSAEVTLDITKWFAYATKAGTPAWNENTGLAINGGPGA